MKKYLFILAFAFGTLIAPHSHAATYVWNQTSTYPNLYAHLDAPYTSGMFIGQPNQSVATGTPVYFGFWVKHTGFTWGTCLYAYVHSYAMSGGAPTGAPADAFVLNLSSFVGEANAGDDGSGNSLDYYYTSSTSFGLDGSRGLGIQLGPYGNCAGTPPANWYNDGSLNPGNPEYLYGYTPAYIGDTSHPSGPSPSGAMIEFNYPADGSTTPLFSNWIVSSTARGISPYTIGVNWAGATSTLLNPQPPYSYGQDIVYGLQATTTANIINYIPATIYQTSATTTKWYAQAFIQTPGPITVVLATSTIIEFTIDNRATPIVDNTPFHPGQGFLQPLGNATGTFCVAPQTSGIWDITQIGPGIAFGLCSVAGTFFGNQTPSYQFMQTQWTAFQSVPPFNLVFGVASSAATAVSNASTSQQDLSVNFAIGPNSASVPVLNSSTLTRLFITSGNGSNIPACNSACAIAKKDTLFQYEAYVIQAGTLITTAAMIL